MEGVVARCVDSRSVGEGLDAAMPSSGRGPGSPRHSAPHVDCPSRPRPSIPTASRELPRTLPSSSSRQLQSALRTKLADADDPDAERDPPRRYSLARWVGQYTIGPPRFSDRASTIHALRRLGRIQPVPQGQVRHGTLSPPADPGATPTPGDPYANQLTGVAGLFNQNILQSSSVARARLERHGQPGLRLDTACRPI